MYSSGFLMYCLMVDNTFASFEDTDVYPRGNNGNFFSIQNSIF